MPTPALNTYQESLDYLYSFIDHERRPAATPREAQYNLMRTHALLSAVGNPQQTFSSIVVGGTKGKGSTCAMLESIARSAGYRIGLWTSPHLNSYRERIQVDRQLISRAGLVDAVRRLLPVIERFDAATYGVPTTFELGFALALRYFAEQHVQLAMIEVGLGGRYDVANTLTPLVSVISSISYDHTQVLGNTLSRIAYDKAGIFKQQIPAVTVPQHQEAMSTLAQVAHEVDAPLWIAEENGLIYQEAAGKHPGAVIDPASSSPQARSLRYPVAAVPALRGDFQQENARLALGAAMLLHRQGLTIPDEAMSQGLARVCWDGRLEVVGDTPLIVLDGAHNGDSAQKLAAALHKEFRFARLVLVLGLSRDKHLEDIVAALIPHASSLILTRSRHPRALTDLDRLAAIARPYLRSEPVMTNDIPDALEVARTLAQPDDLICVTGSLFVVGAAREALGLATECD